jgi:cation transport regulator ChaC
MKYFAYGSNCNPKVMDRKGVEFLARRRATLHGYRLRFNKRADRESLPNDIGFANIEADAEGSVEGILYDIADQHLERLDQSERYPEHYGRIEVTVSDGATRQACFAYQAQPDKLAEGLRPSRNYLNHILAASDFLSRQYYEALDKSQVYEGECACCGTHSEMLFIREGDRLHMLCQPCRESRLVWGDARGRRMSVAETSAVMRQLVMNGPGFSSIQELIQEALAREIISP